MLAYVFWHWRRPDTDPGDYEKTQRRFHQALAAEPPAGFLRSLSVAIRAAPWANRDGEAYEDWYLVRDSAALDRLDEGAVSGSRRAQHDAAASKAAGGTAGLYRARVGEPPPAPRHALWFGKPPGMSYDQLFATVRPLASAGRGALWVRQMVLGPTPEMCLQTSEPVSLPAALTPVMLDLRPIFPEES
jgi:hypothetical protein